MNEELKNKSINNEPINTPDDDLYIFEDTTSAGTPMGALERVFSLFAAPGKLIENIMEFPRFITAVIVIVILALVSTVLTMMASPIVANALSIAIAERYGVDFLNMTQSMEIVMGNSFFAFIISWAGIAFGSFISVLFGAAVVKVITLIMKGSATLKQYLSLLMHTAIISLIGGGVVASLLMLATDSIMVFTSLAPILMPNGNMFSILFNLLSCIELFGIWSMVVLAMGVKKFNPGFSTGKSVATAAIYYILTVAFITASTSLAMLSYDFAYNTLHMM